MLAHSPAVALQHYNRAGSLEASRCHDACIDAAADAAARMLRRRAPNLHKPQSVLTLHDLKRKRRRQGMKGNG
jgi:exonuclease I